MKKGLFSCLVLCLILVLSGCVVRTYRATRDRVDQDLVSGNRGYLLGQAPQVSDAGRKTTRTTQMIEVELRPLVKFEKSRTTPEAVEQPVQEIPMEIPMEETVSFQKYTVEKNDTLQKISQKFYGTTKKWMKIYDANKQVLKSPNKIRPGQVLDIPIIPGQMVGEGAESGMKIK